MRTPVRNLPEPPISDDPQEVAVQPKVCAPVKPRNLRFAIEEAFERMGGTDGFVTWIGESTVNKRIFYKEILPKVIPKEVQAEVSGPGGGPVKMVVEWAGGPKDPSPAAAVLSRALDETTSDDE